MRSFGFLLAFLAVFIWWLFMLWGYGFAIESSGLDIRFADSGGLFTEPSVRFSWPGALALSSAC